MQAPRGPRPKSLLDASRDSGGAHSLDRGRRTESLILPECSVEHRRALVGSQRVGEVLARASCLEWIAESFVFGQGTFERRPGRGRIALPEMHESDGAIDRWSQHSDRLADAFSLGQERPKAFGI